MLTYGASHLPPPPPLDPSAALDRDAERSGPTGQRAAPTAGPTATPVQRSLITLKALTYAPTGGIVAAPTTSLPEQLGGARNWDYRFCWLRDATLTLLALMNAGYFDEAEAWRDWLLRSVAGSPDQIADHVRPRRRAPPAGMARPLAARLRGRRARCASATPRTASSSSTSTAR